MSVFTIESVLSDMNGQGVDKDIIRVCQAIKQYSEQECYYFYPKKVYPGHSKDFEIISILENKILIGSCDKDYNIVLKSYLLVDIINLEFLTVKNQVSCLTITFKNSDKLVLDSETDTQAYYQREFIDSISEIYKYLLNK